VASLDSLRFTAALLTKPAPTGLAAETTLQHFVIVTYWVDPSRLRAHLHPRFEPDCVDSDGAAPRALVSVVTFLDRDFRFVVCPWFKSSFGQTNSGEPPRELAGFSNLEAGLVLLTQPTRGFFFRQDGALSSYSIWHDRLRPTVGKVNGAQYRLLQQLDLIPEGDCRNVHSVLIQRSVDFTIYLPPVKIGGDEVQPGDIGNNVNREHG